MYAVKEVHFLDKSAIFVGMGQNNIKQKTKYKKAKNLEKK